MPPNSFTRVNRYGALCAEVYDTDKPFGALADTAFHLARLAQIEGPILSRPAARGARSCPCSRPATM